MKEIKLGFNTKLVFIEHNQLDGDARGWYLVIDNELTMRPLLKAIAPKRGEKVAIPSYSFYLDSSKINEIIVTLSK